MPLGAAPNVVEQRILEQSVRLPPGGAVTAWASLRWMGGHFFTGDDPRTGRRHPIPVVLGGWRDIGRDGLIAVSRERLWSHEVEIIDGVPCTVGVRAAFDEIRREPWLRPAVVKLEMAIAAGLVTRDGMAEWLPSRNGWTGVPFARRVLGLTGGECRTPPEANMRLVWIIDAGLPDPLCNRPLFDLNGGLLGYPDLFDPEAGVVGEYDGADHLERDRRRTDAQREHVFRDHGLEYFELVRGDLQDIPTVVRRMHGTRSRAKFLRPDQRRWTLDPPAWWIAA